MTRVILPLIAASDRARSLTGSLAMAESLATLVRDHGYPARVIVGRKRGTIRIKVTGKTGRRGRMHWTRHMLLPANRDAVRAWLGY